MERFLLQKLKTWKDSPGRKPLILQGARQVGKTWLLKEFGRRYFDSVCYLNCEKEQALSHIFEKDLSPQTIIQQLSLFARQAIEPHSTLIILDEVQEIPRALTSLKYFAEEASEYAICCAGSLLGVALHQGTSFPVGKVDFLQLEPMSFSEFLNANGEKDLAEYVESGNWNLKAFHDRLISFLKTYLVIGGMPAAVNTWITSHDFEKVDEELNRILESYYNDFSKHSPAEVGVKIRYIWDSIPVQLARENKKFVYGTVREGARAREYENALMWLHDSGAIRYCYCLKKPDIPLTAYADLNAFKIYLLDVGMLRAKARISPSTIIEGNAIFTDFKGSLTEQYVLQELSHLKIESGYYWTGTRAEVDFVVSDGKYIYPIEVKAGINKQAKSLGLFIRNYCPKLAFRASLSDPGKRDELIDIPLYAVSSLIQLIERYNTEE